LTEPDLTGGVQVFLQPRLAARCRVGVNDPLGGRLVDHLHGLDSIGTGCIASLGGGKGVLDAGTKFGTQGAIADTALLVLTVSLDLALDVGHRGTHLI